MNDLQQYDSSNLPASPLGRIAKCDAPRVRPGWYRRTVDYFRWLIGLPPCDLAWRAAETEVAKRVAITEGLILDNQIKQMNALLECERKKIENEALAAVVERLKSDLAKEKS